MCAGSVSSTFSSVEIRKSTEMIETVSMISFLPPLKGQGLNHRVSIERKCPYMKKLKGEGNIPSYFDNNDVTYI